MSDQDRLIIQIPQSQVADASEVQIYRCPITNCPHLIRLPDDGIIVAWLDEKTGKSQSWKTHVSYHSEALSLRQTLQAQGYDLLTDLSDDTRYASFLLIVQRWAGSRAATSRRRGEIKPATYNHRLAVISSLYDYAKRMRLYRGDNPIDAIEQICHKYLKTSKSHVIRHTASLALDDLGVPTSEVQSFLRHKNISTTSTYLKRARRARNKYGRDLEQVFGISARQAQDDVG